MRAAAAAGHPISTRAALLSSLIAPSVFASCFLPGPRSFFPLRVPRVQGNIRGLMHLDKGQEAIPALVSDAIKTTDIKFSYYREHCHALGTVAKCAPPHSIDLRAFFFGLSFGLFYSSPFLNCPPPWAASGVSPDAIMAELFGKIGGTCKGTGGSMHIYDKATFFQVPKARAFFREKNGPHGLESCGAYRGTKT